MTKSTSLVLSVLAFIIFSCKTTVQSEKDTTQQEPKVIVDSYENMRSSYIGKFTYMADAAVFEDCRVEERFSIQPTADIYDGKEVYLELENYYTQNTKTAGAPIYIEIEGTFVEKPEGEEGLQKIMVPSRFKVISKAEAKCE